MADFDGRTAPVTGSTRGIVHRATATPSATRGAHVLTVGRNDRRARDAVAWTHRGGGRATIRLTTSSDLESDPAAQRPMPSSTRVVR